MMFAETMDMLPGWFGVLIQGGSFAVLIYFLIYALPKFRREVASEQNEQLKTFREDVREQRNDFTRALTEIIVTFRAEATAERGACEKHFGSLAEAVGKGNEATIQAVRTIADQVTRNAEQTQRHGERNRDMINLLRQALKNKGVPDPTSGDDEK